MPSTPPGLSKSTSSDTIHTNQPSTVMQAQSQPLSSTKPPPHPVAMPTVRPESKEAAAHTVTGVSHLGTESPSNDANQLSDTASPQHAAAGDTLAKPRRRRRRRRHRTRHKAKPSEAKQPPLHSTPNSPILSTDKNTTQTTAPTHPALKSIPRRSYAHVSRVIRSFGPAFNHCAIVLLPR